MAKIKILVVDDNPFICRLLQSRLTANQYDVVIASSGEEALKKAKSDIPDVILLDISMPEMDGVEVGRRLREDNTTKNIPIIMVTARGEHSIVVQVMELLGPVGYVVKPFNPDKLLDEIKKALEKRGQ